MILWSNREEEARERFDLPNFTLGLIQFVLTLYILIAIALGLEAWQSYRRCRDLQQMFRPTGYEATRAFCAAASIRTEDR